MRVSWVLFLVLLAGCGLFENEQEFASLNEARNTWEKGNYTDYTFNYRIGCFCFYTGEVTVVVEGNEVIRLLNPETGEDATYAPNGEKVLLLDEVPELFYTIDEFFAMLSEEAKEAHTFEFEYNRTSGMPTSVFIDHIKDAVDDEVGYTLSNLVLN